MLNKKTNSFIKTATVAACSLIVAGCNTGYVEPLSEKKVSEYVPGQNPENGYLIGSFSVHGHTPGKMAKAFGNTKFEYSRYSVYFKEIGGTAGAEPVEGRYAFDARPMFGGSVNSDFDVTEGRGHVVVIPLAAGNYEFNRWSLYHNNGSVEYSFGSRNDFSVPFRVDAGEAVYIGEIDVEHVFGKNLFGGAIPGGGIFSCSEKYDRDLPLIKADFGFIESVPVKAIPVCEAFNAAVQGSGN